MATNVVSSGVNAFNPAIVGGLGATYKIFPAPSNNFTVGASSTTLPCTVGIPANGQFEGQRFVVTAGGKIFVHGTSPTLLFAMYNGTSLAVGSDGTALVVLASALTGLTTNNYYPWTWQTVYQGDTSSGVLQAVSSSLWINNATAGTVTLNGATGINFTAGGPVNISGPGYTSSTGANALNLIIGVEFTVTDALNKCYMNQFQAEA